MSRLDLGDWGHPRGQVIACARALIAAKREFATCVRTSAVFNSINLNLIRQSTCICDDFFDFSSSKCGGYLLENTNCTVSRVITRIGFRKVA